MGHGDSHALSEGAYADTDGIALSHFGRCRRDVKRLRGARPNARSASAKARVGGTGVCRVHGFSTVTPRQRSRSGARPDGMLDPATVSNRFSPPQSEATTRVFSLAARMRSFVYAGRGLRTMIASQHNAWIHGVATCSTVGLGLALGIARLEWLALVVAIVSVWTAEAINTAFELLCDVASPEFHPLVEAAKDVAAGAVLICAVGAAITGVIVLGPQLISVLSQR
jgi:diacylglycerol kinase (ATP)